MFSFQFSAFYASTFSDLTFLSSDLRKVPRLHFSEIRAQKNPIFLRSELRKAIDFDFDLDICSILLCPQLKRELLEILTEFTNDREPYFKTCSSKDDTCPNAGMKMPPIPMQNSEFYGFSEFWYSMEEVLGMGKTHFYLIMD